MSAILDLEADMLPGILRELAELIGLPATLKLVEAYGGVRLYVPKKHDPDHPLAKLIGHDAAAKLVEYMGGEDHWDVPKAEGAIRAARNARIRMDRARGDSHRQLALRYGLTERQIRNILSGCEDGDDRQFSMF